MHGYRDDAVVTMDVGMDMVKRIVEVMDMDDRYDDNSGSSDDVGEVNKTSLNPRGGNPLGVLVQPSNGSHLGFQKNTAVVIDFFLQKNDRNLDFDDDVYYEASWSNHWMSLLN